MKIKILSALSLAAAIFTVHAAGIEDMQGLNLKHIKIPFYKKDILERVVFAQDGERDGRLVDCNNTFIDTLLEKIDVDKIPDGWQTKIYPLGSRLPVVLNFWKNRHNISEYVIFTQKCFIDQNNAVAFGDKEIFFRHPQFDLNGIGFKADFKNKVIEVNSDVRIIVRSAETDPRKILTGAPVPKQLKNVTATGDSLRIDMKNNEIMLIGNVKVIDGNNTMTCDRLTAYLANKEDDKKEVPAKKTDTPEDEKAILDGVRRILADGNVLLVQKPDDPAKAKTGVQTSRSEHLEYDVKRELIILTGDGEEDKPTLTRGADTQLTGHRIELLRHADRMFVMRDCRIKSVLRDKKGLIERTRTIFSDRANFDGKANVANFHGNVIAVDQTSSLYTDSLRVHLN
jgi:lipopolysaccharide export system protein LptA